MGETILVDIRNQFDLRIQCVHEQLNGNLRLFYVGDNYLMYEIITDKITSQDLFKYYFDTTNELTITPLDWKSTLFGYTANTQFGTYNVLHNSVALSDGNKKDFERWCQGFDNGIEIAESDYRQKVTDNILVI